MDCPEIEFDLRGETGDRRPEPDLRYQWSATERLNHGKACLPDSTTTKRWYSELIHLFVRCYKLKFQKCVMSPRSKSVCSRQMLGCTLQNAIQTAWMDCTVMILLEFTVMYSGIHFVQIVRTGGICRKRIYNSATQINLQYLCLKQNLRLPVFPVS